MSAKTWASVGQLMEGCGGLVLPCKRHMARSLVMLAHSNVSPNAERIMMKVSAILCMQCIRTTKKYLLNYAAIVCGRNSSLKMLLASMLHK